MTQSERNLQIDQAQRKGVALVIILAFVVLLTGLIIAFFSRSLLDRQISDSSASEAKVSAFADGAVSAIVGNLKQEIVLTSSAIPLTSATIYVPLTSAAMLPQVSGTAGITGTSPNLLKISGSGQLFYAGTSGTIPSTCISNVIFVSSTVPSLNGRYVTPARWNKHYLLPLYSSTDSTPQPTSFIPPSWILVARDGSNPAPLSLSPSMTASGTDPVVGRYAFAIYNEGGLLDANVAGYPQISADNQLSYKSAISYADLNQIPGITGTAIDALVAWRNGATTAQAAGSSFLTPSFSATSSSNYFAYVTSNTTGFLVSNTATLPNGQTDRAFTSRQELISFFQNGLGFSGTNLDVLNYFTHYSRALDQPSYVPSVGRPGITGNSSPPAASNFSTYQGNNTYFGQESSINMTGTGGSLSGGILSVRVLAPFQRGDGTTAVVGEPLVKRKFALSRLTQVSTNATAPAINTNSVYAEFGLSRLNSVNTPWVYNHSANPNQILTLQQVAQLTGTAARDPDFAELLKAAINVGSVGKGAPVNQKNAFGYEYANDVSGDLQILQIMANLIDQQKTDNYPTWIQFTDANNTVHNIYGVQDLPYLYRWHYFGVTTLLPSRLLSSANTIVVPSGTSTATLNHASPLIGPATQPGSATYMIIPEVWNPHDANSNPPSAGPTSFRIVVQTSDPLNSTTNWLICAAPGDNGGPPVHFDGAPFGYELADSGSTSWSTPVALNSGNATLPFSVSSSGSSTCPYFREPTLLWKNFNGVTLGGAAVSDTVAGVKYYGITIGTVPVQWTNTIPYILGSSTVTGVCLFQTSTLSKGPDPSEPINSIPDEFTFRTQYLDTAGNWLDYGVSYYETSLTDIPSFTLFVNKGDYTGQSSDAFDDPMTVGINASGPPLTAPMGDNCDPRTNRFGPPISGHYTDDNPTLNGNPSLDSIVSGSNVSNNLGAGVYANIPGTNFVLMKTQRPGTSIGESYEYTTPCVGSNWQMGWYSSRAWNGGTFPDGNADSNYYEGLLSQNNPALTLYARDNATVVSEYYTDPDGVVRRAMGGYVPTVGTTPQGTGTSRYTNMMPTATSGTASIGLPMFTSGTVTAPGVVTPSSQSQSRPIILHRPFRSVAEMSYAFRGTPWKNIDFFTPESGDTGLLDVFCVNEPPPSAIVAGKVNLNTQQEPVLQAILANSYRDELANSPDALLALSSTEAGKIANLLVGITGSSATAGRGPLTNVGDLVGRFVQNPPTGLLGADYYQCLVSNTSGAVSGTDTFEGLSAALSGTMSAQDGSDIWDVTPTHNNISSRNIQRFRESAIRPLAECGQTRVWNLLIDVIAQTGRYPAGQTNIGGGFTVEGEKRYWIHIAIDRLTGQVIDRQVETVPE